MKQKQAFEIELHLPFSLVKKRQIGCVGERRHFYFKRPAVLSLCVTAIISTPQNLTMTSEPAAAAVSAPEENEEEEVIKVVELLDLPLEMLDRILSFLPDRVLMKTMPFVCKTLGPRATDVLTRRLADYDDKELSDYIERTRGMITKVELDAVRIRHKGPLGLKGLGSLTHRLLSFNEYIKTDIALLFLADYESWYLDNEDKSAWWEEITTMFLGPAGKDRAERGFCYEGTWPEAMAWCHWFFVRLAQEILDNERFAAHFSWSDFTRDMAQRVLSAGWARQNTAEDEDEEEDDPESCPFPMGPFQIQLITRAAVQRFFDGESSPSLEEMGRQLDEELRRVPTSGAQFHGWRISSLIGDVGFALSDAALFNGFKMTDEDIVDVLLACPYFVSEILRGQVTASTRDMIEGFATSRIEHRQATTQTAWKVPVPANITAKIQTLIDEMWQSARDILRDESIILTTESPPVYKSPAYHEMKDVQELACGLVNQHVVKHLPALPLQKVPKFDLSPDHDNGPALREFAREYRLDLDERPALEELLEPLDARIDRPRAKAVLEQYRPGNGAEKALLRMLAYRRLHERLIPDKNFLFSETAIQNVLKKLFNSREKPGIPQEIKDEVDKAEKEWLAKQPKPKASKTPSAAPATAAAPQHKSTTTPQQTPAVGGSVPETTAERAYYCEKCGYCSTNLGTYEMLVHHANKKEHKGFIKKREFKGDFSYFWV